MFCFLVLWDQRDEPMEGEFHQNGNILGRAGGGWKPGYQLVTHLNSNEAQSCWDIFLTNANESKARRLPKKIPIQDICILYIV